MTLLPIFQEKGSLINIVGRQYLSLHQAKSIWYLEEGTADIFSIATKPEQVIKERTFLVEVNAGELLFPFQGVSSEDPYCLIAKLNHGTKLWQMPLNILKEQKNEDPALMQAMETWISKLYLCYPPPLVRDNCSIAQIGEKTHSRLLDTMIIPHKVGIVWFTVEEGGYAIYGNENFSLRAGAAPFPLIEDTWLSSQDHSAYSIQNLEHTTHCWEGFWAFQDYSFQGIRIINLQHEAEDMRQIHLKNTFNKNLLKNAEDHILSGLKNGRTYGHASERDPLMRALKILAHDLEITLVSPRDLPAAEDSVDRITQICSASHVPMRTLELKPLWWKKTFSSFIGFYKESGRPVAILQRYPNHYEIIDGQRQSNREVTKELAESLAPIACVLYPPLPSGSVTTKELLSFALKGQSKALRYVLTLGVLGALIALFPAFASEIVFSTVIPNGDTTLLTQVMIGLVIAAFTTGIFFLNQSFVLLRTLGRSIHTLQSGIWDRVLKLPMSFFRRFVGGEPIRRASVFENAHQLLSANTIIFLMRNLFAFFYLLAMFYFSWRLSLIVMALLGVGFILTRYSFTRSSAHYYKMLDHIALANSSCKQYILSIDHIRISSTETHAFVIWRKRFWAAIQSYERGQKFQNIVQVYNDTAPYCATTLIYITLMYNDQLELSLPIFIGFQIAFTLLSQSAFSFFTSILSFAQLAASWRRARPIIETEPERTCNKIRAGMLFGDINVENIWYRYNKMDRLILKNINFAIEPGEFIGIVGPSGSGKTSLIRLLVGLELPSEGHIFYNRKELISLDLVTVHKQMGIILQDEELFQTSIYENIVGNDKYLPEQLEKAIYLSGFHQDIKKLPNGLQTQLGRGGTPLSDGQKQRLLLTRALIKNPKILILDEATGALDNKSQSDIFQNLENLHMTKIVITHRLLNLKAADRIYVLDKGRIVQEGNFHQLSKKEGLFADLLEQKIG